ncbi:hypothetical protein OH77DRAFT_285190 [Trametes cingulata]|nr:hypothetical protein OH77DRAFT_285190 [Trametes cingulata]
MSTFIAILTATMTSRFILDLHEAADVRAGTTSASASAASGTGPSGDTLSPRTGRASALVFGGSLSANSTEREGEEDEEGWSEAQDADVTHAVVLGRAV